MIFVDIERALPLRKTKEESVEALLDELAVVLDMVTNADIARFKYAMIQMAESE